MPKGQCRFDSRFLSDTRYSLWLAAVNDDKYKARCTLCNKDFCVKSGCESSIQSHAKGKIHNENLKTKESMSKSLSSFYFKSTSSESFNSSKQTKDVQKGLDHIVEGTLHVLHAEITWAMKVVRSHFSFRSCDGIRELFKEMFTDSTIAKDFKMARQK